MNSSKLGDWLQIIGNFGLIIGLILVAVQIKQSNDLSKAQMLNDGWLAAVQRNVALFGENPAKSIARALAAPDQLTDEDLVVLEAVTSSYWSFGVRRDALQAAGYGYDSLDNFAVAMSDQLDSPYGLAWWNVFKDHPFIMASPALKHTVERMLTDLGPAVGSGQSERQRKLRAYISEHWQPRE